MKKSIKLLAMATIIASISLFGCQKKSKTLAIKLTDDLPAYDEVKVEIIGVDVRIDADVDRKSGWVSLNASNGIYDLTTLENKELLIGLGMDLPVGDITDIRLMLGIHNSVKIGAVKYDLSVPNGPETIIKVTGVNLEEDEDKEIVLDFHVAESIESIGSNKYSLKPAITMVK